MMPEYVAFIMAALHIIAHGCDVHATVRNLDMGMKEDNPLMARLIYALKEDWRWVKLSVGTAVACLGLYDPTWFTSHVNAIAATFVFTVAWRNYASGTRYAARH